MGGGGSSKTQNKAFSLAIHTVFPIIENRLLKFSKSLFSNIVTFLSSLSRSGLFLFFEERPSFLGNRVYIHFQWGNVKNRTLPPTPPPPPVIHFSIYLKGLSVRYIGVPPCLQLKDKYLAGFLPRY